MAEIRISSKEDGAPIVTGAFMHYIHGPITTKIDWERHWLDITQGWTSFTFYFKDNDELRMFIADLAIKAGDHSFAQIDMSQLEALRAGGELRLAKV